MDRAMDDEVRRRAFHRCEYCRVPQKAYRPRFQIDHIIAQKHGGPTVLENLALCCVRCNLHKGPNIAGIDPQTQQLVRLFNPRRDRWLEHFDWDGAMLRGLTPEGRTTVIVLQINDEGAVAVRRDLMGEGLFHEQE
jgi:5-methylcytosine-specific restriction endonuclease McrA